MINVIIPVVEDVQKYQKMIAQLLVYSDVNIIVGLTENIDKSFIKEDGVKYLVFKDNTNKEQMINSLSMFVLSGKILILRQTLGQKDLEKFIFSNQSILLAKEKSRNKFVDFFVMLWRLIVHMFFGVGFYQGNTSVIMFSQDLSEVLLQIGNLSYNSRVNRWRGVVESSANVSLSKTDKYPVDKKQNLIYILSSSTLFAVAILFTVLLCLFVNINFILGLLIVCVDIICAFVAIILLMMLAFNNKVGKKNVGEGELIGGNFSENDNK